jgi:hypothetical protein
MVCRDLCAALPQSAVCCKVAKVHLCTTYAHASDVSHVLVCVSLLNEPPCPDLNERYRIVECLAFWTNERRVSLSRNMTSGSETSCDQPQLLRTRDHRWIERVIARRYYL